MSQEITVSATLQVAKNWAAKSLTASFKPDLNGTNFVQESQSIPTTAGGTAINLGNLASLGWYLIKNLDTANNVDLLDAVSGHTINTLKPGECAMGRFASGVTAPAMLAHTASVQVEYLILEN